MKVYEPWTLGQFIEALEKLGDAPVRGFDGRVFSYRGYYERNCTEPSDLTFSASHLAAMYRKEIGKDIEGYKGGDYVVNPGELIYYVNYSETGPAIAGLVQGDDGVYEPVGVIEDGFW